MSHPQSPPAIARHFGLDWLRVGAFALLILYHVALYFGPTRWLVKSPQEVAWVAWPVAAVVPWRLTLLFAVSGYATAAMLARSAGLGAFLRDRAARLLIPLAFAMIVVVPPQDWLRLRGQGVERDYLSFLVQDDFSFRRFAGVFLPNWEHLWFLPTLLGFTALLILALALVPRWDERIGRAGDWLAQGHRLLMVPPVALLGLLFACGKLGLWDYAQYLDYFPAFLFGFVYARGPALRPAVARVFPAAALASLAALAVIWGALADPTLDYGHLRTLGETAAEYAMSWAMMPVLFHAAERLFNRDHRWRAPLAAAVFPAYLVHQTAIVLMGWYLAQRGIVGLPAFLAILGAVVATCAAAWALARTFPLLGELLGMPHKRRMAAPVAAIVPAHEG